jgi:catechol 2,3-dioxygenase-like lactoylglutathione lyase family enzyme
MEQSIAQIALVVKDYDEALSFYIDKLRFRLVEDVVMSETKRWVVIAPQGNGACKLLLAKAATEEQLSRVGNQTGGRVFLFLHTDDLDRDYNNLVRNEVEIVRTPSVEVFGKVCVFADLYGNLWDMIEPNKSKANDAV